MSTHQLYNWSKQAATGEIKLAILEQQSLLDRHLPNYASANINNQRFYEIPQQRQALQLMGVLEMVELGTGYIIRKYEHDLRLLIDNLRNGVLSSNLDFLSDSKSLFIELSDTIRLSASHLQKQHLPYDSVLLDQHRKLGDDYYLAKLELSNSTLLCSNLFDTIQRLYERQGSESNRCSFYKSIVNYYGQMTSCLFTRSLIRTFKLKVVVSAIMFTTRLRRVTRQPKYKTILTGLNIKRSIQKWLFNGSSTDMIPKASATTIRKLLKKYSSQKVLNKLYNMLDFSSPTQVQVYRLPFYSLSKYKDMGQYKELFESVASKLSSISIQVESIQLNHKEALLLLQGQLSEKQQQLNCSERIVQLLKKRIYNEIHMN